MLIRDLGSMRIANSHANIFVPVTHRKLFFGVPPTSGATTKPCMQKKRNLLLVATKNILNPKLNTRTLLSEKIVLRTTPKNEASKSTARYCNPDGAREVLEQRKVNKD